MSSLQVELEQARSHVEEAQRRIEEQVILIERLRSDRHDTAAAERLLATFIDLVAKLTVHRNNLEREAEERARKPVLRHAATGLHGCGCSVSSGSVVSSDRRPATISEMEEAVEMEKGQTRRPSRAGRQLQCTSHDPWLSQATRHRRPCRIEAKLMCEEHWKQMPPQLRRRYWDECDYGKRVPMRGCVEVVIRELTASEAGAGS